MKAAFVFLTVCLVFLEVFLDASPAQLEHRDVRSVKDKKVSTGGEFPYMARFIDAEDEVEAYCRGALISDQHVLTTAGCILNYEFDEDPVVHLGVHHIYKGEEESIPQSLYAERIFLHPKYNERYFQNDIAVVELEEPVNLEDTNIISTICISKESVESLDGEVGIVSAWDETEVPNVNSVLRKFNVRILATDECRTNFSDPTVIHEENLCTNHQKGSFNMGDEGGPLVVNRNGQNQLVGLASWVDDCEDPHPGIYTSVASYANWIRRRTNFTAKFCS